MIKPKLENLILDIYDLPLGKESSDLLQNLMLVLDSKSPFKKRIDSLIDGFCMCLQNLCDDYRYKRIDRSAFCEECAKLAFKMSDKILLFSVERISTVEVTRIEGMKKHVHLLKCSRDRRSQMKNMKKRQLCTKEQMKVIYDELSVSEKVQTSKFFVNKMTQKYKELYKKDCSRSVKTCQRWIREWMSGS